MKENDRKWLKRCLFGCSGLMVAVVLLITAVCVIATTSDNEPTGGTANQTSTRGTGLSDAAIVEQVKQYPEVRDASITRRGRQVGLVLIVGAATSEARARTLGENFVRLYKSHSDDSPPGASIGTGKYDYVIGVYTPTEKQIALGAKVSFADRISW